MRWAPYNIIDSVDGRQSNHRNNQQQHTRQHDHDQQPGCGMLPATELSCVIRAAGIRPTTIRREFLIGDESLLYILTISGEIMLHSNGRLNIISSQQQEQQQHNVGSFIFLTGRRIDLAQVKNLNTFSKSALSSSSGAFIFIFIFRFLLSHSARVPFGPGASSSPSLTDGR